MLVMRSSAWFFPTPSASASGSRKDHRQTGKPHDSDMQSIEEGRQHARTFPTDSPAHHSPGRTGPENMIGSDLKRRDDRTTETASESACEAQAAEGMCSRNQYKQAGRGTPARASGRRGAWQSARPRAKCDDSCQEPGGTVPAEEPQWRQYARERWAAAQGTVPEPACYRAQ